MDGNMLSFSLQDRVNCSVESDMATLMNFSKEAGEVITEDDYSLESFSYTKEMTNIVLNSVSGFSTVGDVKLTFDKKKQLIIVASSREYRDAYSHSNLGNLSGSFNRYHRRVEQKITEFKVSDNSLYVTTAKINQSSVEDSFGGGYGVIITFNSIADLERLGNEGFYSIYKREYKVPVGYRLEDGMEDLNSKMLQKNK